MSAGWTVQPDRSDPEMYEVAGVYLVASNLPIEDAKLIAAAPDLLTALERLVFAIENAEQTDDPLISRAYEAAVKMLAKSGDAS